MKNYNNIKTQLLALTLVLSGCIESAKVNVNEDGTVQIESDELPPNVPSNLRAESITQNSMLLVWDASDDNGDAGIKHYRIYLNNRLVGATTGLSFAMSSLRSDTLLNLGVNAVDKHGNASAVTSIQARTLASGDDPVNAAPAAPVSLSIAPASVTQSSLTLNWSEAIDPEDGAVDSYKILMNGVLGAEVNGLSKNISGLSADTEYRFRVHAVDSEGLMSPASSEIVARTLALVIEDYEAPSVPTQLTSSQITSQSFVVSWAASTDTGGSGMKNYSVFVNDAVVGTTASTSYSVTGRAANTVYNVKVLARDNTNNESAHSTVLQVPTLPVSTGNFEVVEIEAENTTLSSGWSRLTSDAGYSGTGYVKWTGPDKSGIAFGDIASRESEISKLRYDFQIDVPGTYKVVARVRRNSSLANPPADGSNDAFIKLVNFSPLRKFFPEFPFPWNNWITAGKVMTTAAEARETLTANFTSAGTYQIELGGRSPGFQVDKILVTNDMVGPPKPINARIAARSGSQVTIAWDPVIDPEGYPLSHYIYYMDASAVAPAGAVVGNQIVLNNISSTDNRPIRIRAVDHVFNRSTGSDAIYLNDPVSGGTTGGTTSGDTTSGGTNGGLDPVGDHVASDSFLNIPISPIKTGSFKLEFDASVSAAPVNAVIGLSDSPPIPTDTANGFAELAAIMRFSDSGVVQAYNGTSYTAANALAHSAAKNYKITIQVNVPEKKYSVSVLPEGAASAVVIANNYSYRSTQALTSSFSNLSIIALNGGLAISNLVYTDLGDAPLNCAADFLHNTSRNLPVFSVASVIVPDTCANHSLSLPQTCVNGNIIEADIAHYKECTALIDGGGGEVAGDFIQHQTAVINFQGPATSENATPSPFLEYRLNVTVSHPATGTQYVVPGFYDGDGNGNGTGNVWRIRFNPEIAGRWNFTASFRKGTNVAVSTDPNAGTAISLVGQSGYINVDPKDANAPGFLKWGRLEYANNHYLKFRDGPYWIKTGTDDPEDFLGYNGFDNTTNGTSRALHSYSNHVAQWQSGDPDWGSGKGKGIIGALNYLSGKGVNSIYFLPMNIGGDAQNSHPFASSSINQGGSANNDNTRYDISKLTQWETVFSHAQRKGIQLHFVLNEGEKKNKFELDGYSSSGSVICGGVLGVERKLYYRELIARFGHHQAVQWNISEEYDYTNDAGETCADSGATRDPWTASKVLDFAQYIKDIDPVDHPITAHNYKNARTANASFMGNSLISSTSLQYANSDAGKGDEVEYFRAESASRGRPLPVMMDELSPISSSNQADIRKNLLWPTLLSGGGLEYYMGSSAYSLNNFDTFSSLWTWSSIARRFMEENLPFWEMNPSDSLASNSSAQVFAKANQVYAVYVPSASSAGTLNLAGATGSFTLRWFNPRSGAFEGSAQTVQGGSSINLGTAPSSTSDDWVILIKK